MLRTLCIQCRPSESHRCLDVAVVGLSVSRSPRVEPPPLGEAKAAQAKHIAELNVQAPAKLLVPPDEV